jgi:hypothetical protein
MSNYHDVDDYNDTIEVRDFPIKSNSTPELNTQFDIYNKKKFVRNLFKLFKSQNNVNDDNKRNLKFNDKKMFSVCFKFIFFCC